MRRPFLLLLGLTARFLPAAYPQTPASPNPPVVTAFVGVNVIPMDRERVLRDQTVLVQGDRIVAVGPAKRIVVPAGATRVEGRGKYLLPGLADMHVHLDWSGGSAQLLSLYLANGITTVRDMHSTRSGGAQSLPLVLRRQVATGQVLGPRIYTAGDPNFGSPEAAAQSVAALRDLAPDFIKIGNETTPGPVYDSILAAARRAGLRLVGHVPAERGLERVLQDHWASIEHLSGYADYLLGTKNLIDGFPFQQLDWVDTARWMRPGYRLDADQLRQIATATRQAGVWNCPTLALWPVVIDAVESFIAQQDTAKNAPSQGKYSSVQLKRTARPLAHRVAELHFQITKALQDAGAGLLLGTDQPTLKSGIPNGFTIHPELAALIQAGLTPYQALAAGTRNVAQFLGTLDSTGTIAVGKRADLVLLSGNPLKDIGHAAGPAGVVVGGRWLPRAELDVMLDTLTLEPRLAGDVKWARQHIWHY